MPPDETDNIAAPEGEPPMQPSSAASGAAGKRAERRRWRESQGRRDEAGTRELPSRETLRSVVQVSRLLGACERSLPAGSLIMAGAATAAQALLPNSHVRCDISGLGRVEFFTGAQP